MVSVLGSWYPPLAICARLFFMCFEINTAKCSISYAKYCSTVVNVFFWLPDIVVPEYWSTSKYSELFSKRCSWCQPQTRHQLQGVCWLNVGKAYYHDSGYDIKPGCLVWRCSRHGMLGMNAFIFDAFNLTNRCSYFPSPNAHPKSTRNLNPDRQELLQLVKKV